VEPIFGGRTLVDNLTLTLNPGGQVTPRVSFVAPVVGGRTLWDITTRFYIQAEGDYGGFNVNKLKST
jgi:hypothetical protein